MLTAFHSDSSLDWEGNKLLIDHLIKGGVHGILVLGSSGEFDTLTADERKRLTEFVARHINGRVPLLVGTGSCSTAEAIDLSRHAERVGADGVLVVTPYYWRLSEEKLYQHYAAIARAVDIPVLLYHIPMLTNQPLPVQLVRRLALDFENILGIKATVDSVSYIGQLIREVKAVKPQFAVLAGFDDHLFNTLAMGGDGAIPGTANVFPEICVGLYESFRKGDFVQSQRLLRSLLPLLQLYDLDTPPMGILKEACRQRGVRIEPHTRHGDGVPSAEKVDQIRKILQQVSVT